MKNSLVSSISSFPYHHTDYVLENMQCDDNEAESIIILPDPVERTITINYDRCCLWENGNVSTCGPAQHREIFLTA